MQVISDYCFDNSATVLDLDFNASDTHSVNIPAEGIKVSDIFVTATRDVTTNITAAIFTFVSLIDDCFSNMTRKKGQTTA